MNKYTIFLLLTFLSGFSIATANASDDTSTAISPVVAGGAGPVINPENSQYMADKHVATKKEVRRSKAHNKKHHGKKHRTNKRHYNPKKY